MKHQLRKLIAQGKTDTVVQALLKITRQIENDELHMEVIIHSNRYREYLKDKRLGVSSPQERQRDLVQINQSLLFVINQLPDETKSSLAPEESIPSFPARGKSRRRYTIAGVIALFFVVVLALAIINTTSKGTVMRKPGSEAVPGKDTVKENTTLETEKQPSNLKKDNLEKVVQAPTPILPDTAGTERQKKRESTGAMDLLKGRTVVVKGNTEADAPSFLINKYEVTIGQYLLFCQKTGRPFPEEVKDTTNKDLPINYVSWIDATEYCQHVGGRLPTVAEWEYAATGGGESGNYIFSGGNEVKQVGWSAADGISSPQPVGRRKANELGIFDMSGNVREWCLDEAPNNNKYRLVKGGAWKSYATMLDPKKKTKPELASSKDDMTGFRVVFDLQ